LIPSQLVVFKFFLNPYKKENSMLKTVKSLDGIACFIMQARQHFSLLMPKASKSLRKNNFGENNIREIFHSGKTIREF